MRLSNKQSAFQNSLLVFLGMLAVVIIVSVATHIYNDRVIGIHTIKQALPLGAILGGIGVALFWRIKEIYVQTEGSLNPVKTLKKTKATRAKKQEKTYLPSIKTPPATSHSNQSINKTQLKKVRKLVLMGDFKVVIPQLHDMVPENSSYKQDLDLIELEHNSLKSDTRQQTISSETLFVRKNKIGRSLLDIIYDLENLAH